MHFYRLIETGTMEDFVDLALIGATKFGGNSLFAPGLYVLYAVPMLVIRFIRTKVKDRDITIYFGMEIREATKNQSILQCMKQKNQTKKDYNRADPIRVCPV